MDSVIPTYLDLLDRQRESAYAAVAGCSVAQLWQRPAPKEWCIGEILDHNYRVFASFFPFVQRAWKAQRQRAEKRRGRPYATDMEDPYRKKSFPHWTGFLWTPHYHPEKPAPLDVIMKENRDLHAAVRAFYEDKDADLLGNISVYDPLMGSMNLIIVLRVGIYHDQLHFDDVLKMVRSFAEAG